MRKIERILSFVAISSWLMLSANISDAIEINTNKVLLNGAIYTVDSQKKWAEAVVIKDGKFVYVGTNERAKEYITKNTQVRDLDGAFVMPGFIDMHVHAIEGEISQANDCLFAMNSTADDIAAAIKECEKNSSDREWITGGFFSPTLVEDYKGKPIRELMDEVTGDKPLFVWDISHHHAILNSKALELTGIIANPTAVKGGIIHKDSATGKPNGFVSERQISYVLERMPQYSNQEMNTFFSDLQGRMHSLGITGWKEAMPDISVLETYNRAEKQGDLRAYVTSCYGYGEGEDALEAAVSLRDKFSLQLFKADCAKIFVDGITVTKTALMLDPYVADEKHGDDWRGKSHLNQAELTQALKGLDSKGITVKMHASGDGSARMVLNAAQATRQSNGNKNLQHELAHLFHVSPEDMPRFSDLNIVGEMSPTMWYRSPLTEFAIKPAVGEVRTGEMFQAKTLLSHNAHVTYGSDWAAAESLDPLVGLESIVTRQNPNNGFVNNVLNWWWGPLGQEQGIDIGTAIEIFTLNNAKTLRRGDVTGSISVGKSADFIILDENLTTIDATQISEANVVETFFAGEKVYSKK